MNIHITNIYGMSGTAIKCQHMVADIAKRFLGFNELGIYHYQADLDSEDILRVRMDGITASVSYQDFDNIIIFQLPTWNGIAFDEALIRHLKVYRKLKMVFFIHDVTPLMFESNRYLLKRYIDLYNQADLIILPSQPMIDFLRTEGLSVSKIVVQRMWDCKISIDTTRTPRFRKVFNFAGSVDEDKFSFAKKWQHDVVKLSVTAEEREWGRNRNIEFLGWFNSQDILADTLRKNGGFGLLWTEDSLCEEYMKLNACDKLSLYLASGLPVIVHKSIPEAETVIHKNMGFAVDSLEEAVFRVNNMTEEQYDQMARKAGLFGNLLREGYFTKKVLLDAVFKLLYA